MRQVGPKDPALKFTFAKVALSSGSREAKACEKSSHNALTCDGKALLRTHVEIFWLAPK